MHSCIWCQALSQNPTHFSPCMAHPLFYLPLASTPLSHKRSLTGKEWIRDPFVNKPGKSTLSVQEEDQLLVIANDGGLKSMFETTSNLRTFCIKVKAEYLEIATKALKSLLLFPTSYLCEAGFSAVAATRTRLRSRLDISNTFRVSLSPITSR